MLVPTPQEAKTDTKRLMRIGRRWAQDGVPEGEIRFGGYSSDFGGVVGGGGFCRWGLLGLLGLIVEFEYIYIYWCFGKVILSLEFWGTSVP